MSNYSRGRMRRTPATLWRDLNEAGWRVTKVGKAVLVVEGAPKSAVRSIEFEGKGWKPAVRMVLKAPEKK